MKIDSYTLAAMQSSPTLHNLLHWADRITTGAAGNYKPAAKRAIAIYLDRDLDRDRDRDLDRDFDRARARALDRYQIFSDVNFTTLVDNLESLPIQIPGGNLPREVRRAFVQRLQDVWLNALHLQPNWIVLSPDELQMMVQYLQFHQLMVKCKHNAVRVSRQTWADIEDRMLKIRD
jgi:hypothetical protein